MPPPAPKPDGDRPPSLEDVVRVVSEFVTTLMPSAVGCRLLIDVPGDDDGVLTNRIQIPLTVSDGDDDQVAKALAALGRYRPGEWMPGKVLAAELDVAARSGHFKRIIFRLKETGKVESHKSFGYRLIPPK